MAVHVFYLSWLVEYDYTNPAELTEKREKLIQLLSDNGYAQIYFCNLFDSERCFHEYLEKTAVQKRKKQRERGKRAAAK